MLTVILQAAADLLTSTTTSSLTTNDQSQSQQLSNRFKNVYATKQSAFYPQLFGPKQAIIPQLVFDDDVQINENVVMNSATSATEAETETMPGTSSSIFAPAFSHITLTNRKTPAATTRTMKMPSLYTASSITTTAATLTSSAISAVTSTLVKPTTTTTTTKTTTNLTMPTQTPETLPAALLLSSTPTSTLAATSTISYATSTLSTFLEGDLLPVVFLNSNIVQQHHNNSISTTPTHFRSNITLGLGGGGGGGGGGVSGTGSGMTFDDDDDNLNSFYFYEPEQFTVLWILFATIVLGNSAVLLVMFLNKNRKSRMNYFIKQLALADLLVGLLSVLTDIIWRMTISWRAGNVACKIIRFSQVCVTYSSTYVLVAMSIDRYDAITHPMNFSKSWKRARYLVTGAWGLSAAFSTPMLGLYEERLVQGQIQCWIDLGTPQSWQIYMVLVALSLFVFPALIISFCYAVIVKTIWANGSIFVPADRGGYSSNPARRASSRGIIPRAKVKTVKMTIVIVIVFILCWSPYIIFDLLQVFNKIPQTQTNIAIATFIQSLAPLNSAANPLIYCLFSSTVFRTLSRYPPFKWFTCCCKSYRRNSSQNRCNTVGRRLHNSCDSMRTLTTSLTVSRRSNKRTTHVIIADRPKSNSITHNAMSEV